jgi:hypothetical protein
MHIVFGTYILFEGIVKKLEPQQSEREVAGF